MQPVVPEDPGYYRPRCARWRTSASVSGKTNNRPQRFSHLVGKSSRYAPVLRCQLATRASTWPQRIDWRLRTGAWRHQCEHPRGAMRSYVYTLWELSYCSFGSFLSTRSQLSGDEVLTSTFLVTDRRNIVAYSPCDHHRQGRRYKNESVHGIHSCFFGGWLRIPFPDSYGAHSRDSPHCIRSADRTALGYV